MGYWPTSYWVDNYWMENYWMGTGGGGTLLVLANVFIDYFFEDEED
jgi:hypothetical protein